MMESVDFYLVWQSPWLGIAAVLALALLLLLRTARRKHGDSRFAAAARRSTVSAAANHRQRPLFIIAWLCASLALGGPLLSRQDTTPTPNRVRDIALVVDISPSMALADPTPSRLMRAQWKIEQLTKTAAATRFGLIAFSANAYVALPLTVDGMAVAQFARALNPQMVTRKGSNLQRALDLAAQMLTDSAPDSRAIVVFSDGDVDPAIDLSPPRDDIPIITVGVGSAVGAPVTTANGHALLEEGRPVLSRLNSNALRNLAVPSGGFYQEARADDSDVTQIHEWLSNLAARQTIATPQQGDHALAPPLLFLCVVLFLAAQFGLPRRLARASAFFIAFTVADTAQAAPWSELLAWQAFNRGDHQSALDNYTNINSYGGRMGFGAAAYRLGDWHASLTAFQQAEKVATSDEQRAHATFNQGNAWAQLGEVEKAIDAYGKALRYAPGYSRAGLNLNQLTLKQQSGARMPGQSNLPTHPPTDTAGDSTDAGCAAPPCVTSAATQPMAGVSALVNTATPSPRDPVNALLQRRFSRQDYLDGLSRSETRPW